MSRNAVRTYLMLSCLTSLGLAHLLWAVETSQPPVTIDATVLDNFVARNVGPAHMSGRIVQITAVEGDAKTMYVAAASGGLLKTTDGGGTWASIFDNQSSICIGDVAVSASNPNVVWVGTGEHNIRNSVAWGDGVYKSTDGGKTWQNMGLRDSHTVGRIAIHPTNPDIVYVAALGHVWGPNKERGVFKTTDGGKTWDTSKFIDEDTGFIDFKMDPSDPNTLYAAAYRARRDAFSGSDNPSVFFLGEKAGLYKTTDGGKNWEQLVVALPESKYGRCGIDIYRKDPNIVYAVVQTDKTPVGEVNQGGKTNGQGGPAMGGIYRSEDKGKTWKHMNTLCPRPFYFGEVRVDPNDDKRIYVLGVSTLISTDGGKTFPAGKGGKGDDGDAPKKDDGGGFRDDQPYQGDQTKDEQKKDDQKKDELKKDDQKKDDLKKDEQKKDEPKKDQPFGGMGGGKKGGGASIHDDHHATWINPKDSNEVWQGTDGGFGISKNKGQNYQAIRCQALGQFYGISVDMSRPYYIYGGLQDNDNAGGPSATYDAAGIRQSSWFSFGGGDGFHTQCDPTDLNTVYCESQYGNFNRVSVASKGAKGGKGGGGGGGGKGLKVTGKGNRWNWSTPLVLSPHDLKTVYYGSQYLNVSTERGGNWKKISPDLTFAPKEGNVKNWKHTLFTIGESPKKKGVIWTGADDGRVMVTKDGGQNWTEAKMPGIPKEGCVSRVEPSHHDAGTCYVSITRYRNDDRKPYIFKTTDYGETWTNISANLPVDGSVHVVIESSKNPRLLFCGTEFGLFGSLDGGKSWRQMKAGLPTVAVHDLVIHPRDRDLVIGTHGRSIYVMDDISPLEETTPDVAAKQYHLFTVRPTVAFKPKATVTPPKSSEFVGQNPPYGSIIRFNLRTQADASLAILDPATGKELRYYTTKATQGLHTVVWDLKAGGALVQPGEYLAVLETGDRKQYRMFKVEPE